MDLAWMGMLQMISGGWVSQLVGAAARLRLPDLLADGPRPVPELAAAVGAHLPSLARLMRALASIGVLSSPSPGVYGLTPLGSALRSGTPGSVRELVINETDAAHWAAWQRLTESVLTGEPQARAALGMEPWEWYGQHPEAAATFSAAMGNLSALALQAVLSSYDVSRCERIVDVGGAHGVFLAGLLAAAPSATGVLFDLPHVIAGAPARARIETASGDFFAGLPAGGDLYVLKHILHDWDDERCVRILSSVKAAMRSGAKVAVIELLLPPGVEPGPAQLLDISMMVLLGGMERGERDYAALFEAAGLSLSRTVYTPGPWVVLEAVTA